MMDIGVAIGASAKGDSGIAGLSVAAGSMALFALYLTVLTRQRVACLAMVELANRDCFPINIVVTLLAIGTQAALVNILVARGAGLGCPEKCSRQVLDLDDGARRRGNVFRGVAFVTGDTLMFPFENVAREIVVEGLGVPLDQGKVFTVVFGVAFGTSVIVALWQFICGMQAFASTEPASNFSVTADTLERRGGTEFVAVGAVKSTIERLVGAGKRAGRNLRERGFRKAHYS